MALSNDEADTIIKMLNNIRPTLVEAYTFTNKRDVRIAWAIDSLIKLFDDFLFSIMYKK